MAQQLDDLSRSLTPLEQDSTIMRARPAPASRANNARSAAKNGLDTPFDTDQNTSPEVGCTKAVT